MAHIKTVSSKSEGFEVIYVNNTLVYVDDVNNRFYPITTVSGTPGAQGPQGPQGDLGISGSIGPQGAQGPQGSQGIQGIQGPIGVSGTIGAQGSQGIQGIQGLQGLQGIQGDPGISGAVGAQGPAYTATYVNEQLDTYTLQAVDSDSIVDMNKSTAVTVTVPESVTLNYLVGTIIVIRQKGAGQVTIAPANGNVIINSASGLKISVQYGMVSLVKVGTDIWTAVGNLEV